MKSLLTIFKSAAPKDAFSVKYLDRKNPLNMTDDELLRVVRNDLDLLSKDRGIQMVTRLSDIVLDPQKLEDFLKYSMFYSSKSVVVTSKITYFQAVGDMALCMQGYWTLDEKVKGFIENVLPKALWSDDANMFVVPNIIDHDMDNDWGGDRIDEHDYYAEKNRYELLKFSESYDAALPLIPVEEGQLGKLGINGNPIGLDFRLPYIEGITANELYKIRLDNLDSYDRFKDYLNQTLNEISKSDSEQKLKFVFKQLQEGVGDLTDKLSGIKRKVVNSLSGFTLSTTGLVLIEELNLPKLGVIMSAIGGTTLIDVVKDIKEIKNTNTTSKQSPFYFPFLIKTQADRKKLIKKVFG